MANTVEYIYEVLDRFSGPLKNFDQLTRKNEERLKSFSKSAISAGKTLSMSVTTPLVGFATASAYAFGQFEAQMASVSTLIDTNVESMKDMSDAVLEISKRAPVRIGDLTSALYDIRSAGVSAADAMSVLEGSARLGVAGLGTTKEAVDLVTSSINAFNLQGEEQARIYDLIFKTVKTGKTNISQLAQGFGAVAGTVANAGIQIDEYLASVAALTTTGLPAAQAHTQLRAVIAGLTRPTKESSRLFRRLGAKDLKDLVAKSGGLVPALEKIKEALKGNDAEVLKLVGSTEALAAVIGLTGPVSDAFNVTLSEMRTGANAVDEAFNKQAATFNASMVSMSNAMGRLGIRVGAVLVPYIQMATRALEGLANWFDGLSPTMQTAIVFAGAFAAALGPILIAAGMIASGIGPLLVMLKPLIVALKFVAIAAKAATIAFLGLSLPVIAIIGGIALLAAGIAALVIYWDDVTAAMGRVYQKILPLIEAAKAFMNTGITGLLIRGVGGAINLVTGGGGEAENVAARREAQSKLAVDGGITVRASPGSKVETSNINLNGGNNLATAY